VDGWSGEYAGLINSFGTIILFVSVGMLMLFTMVIILKKCDRFTKILLILFTLPAVILVCGGIASYINDFADDAKQGTIIIELYDCSMWVTEKTESYYDR